MTSRSRLLLRFDMSTATRPSVVRSTSVRPLTASTTPVISVQRRSSRARLGIGADVGATSRVDDFAGGDAGGDAAATDGPAVGALITAGYGPNPGVVGVTAGAGAVTVGAGAAVVGAGVAPFGVVAGALGAGAGVAGVDPAGAAALLAGVGTPAPGSTPFCGGALGVLAVGAAIAAAPPCGAGAAAVGAGALGVVGEATLGVGATTPGVGAATLGVGTPTLGGVTTAGADAADAGFAPCKFESADSTESPAPTPSAVISCGVRPSRPSTATRAPRVSEASRRAAVIVT